MHLPAVYSPIVGLPAGDATAAPRIVASVQITPHRAIGDLFSPMRNFLEITLAGFHYSAIGHFATLGRSLGIAEYHPLNDEVPASTCPEAAAISDVRVNAE